MRRLGSALRVLIVLPPVWLALVALVAAVLTNEPLVDILRYALWRLGLAG